MSDSPVNRMTPEEIRAYRESVEALIAACLERIRAYRSSADSEPPPTQGYAP